jgi:hypothetical protein
MLKVVHQTIGVDHPVESFNRVGQHRKKQRSVVVAPINILTSFTTRSNVVKTMRELEAERTGHDGIIYKSWEGKRKDPVVGIG